MNCVKITVRLYLERFSVVPIFDGRTEDTFGILEVVVVVFRHRQSYMCRETVKLTIMVNVSARVFAQYSSHHVNTNPKYYIIIIMRYTGTYRLAHWE